MAKISKNSPLYNALCEFNQVSHKYYEKKKSFQVQLIEPIYFFVRKEKNGGYSTFRALFIQFTPVFFWEDGSATASIYVYSDRKDFKKDKPVNDEESDKPLIIELAVKENLMAIVELTAQINHLLG